MKYLYFQITTYSRKRRGRVRTTNRGSQKMSTWFRLQNLKKLQRKTECWLYLFLFTVSIKFFPFELNHSNFSAPWLLHVMLNESNNIEKNLPKREKLWTWNYTDCRISYQEKIYGFGRENLICGKLREIIEKTFFREKD